MSRSDKLPPTKIYYNYLTAVTASATSAIAALGDLANMAIDADGTASGSTNYFLSCPADTELLLHRALITIYDAGAAMEAEEYGNLGGSLTAGLELKILSSDSTVLADLTGGRPIKTNAGWAQVCYDTQTTAFKNTTNTMFQARWTFDKGGNPIYLKSGQRLNMAVTDNMSGLLSQRIMVQGHKL